MKEHPILFNASMVRAILDGRKTMTRRVIKPQPILEGGRWGWNVKNGAGWTDGIFSPESAVICGACPWRIGQTLWVRETFSLWCHSFESVGVEYPAGGEYKIVDFPNKVGMPSLKVQCQKNIGDGRRKRPSIYMPRWASRITLEVTGVRVERVQDIKPLTDIPAEGIDDGSGLGDGHKCSIHQLRSRFMRLWDSINSKRGFGWDKNPWVWAISFKRI